MRIFQFVIILLFVNTLSAQETKFSFSEKENQHSITTEYAAVSYSFAHQFNQNLILGIRGQVGFATRFMLTQSSFVEDYYTTPEDHFQGTYNVKPGSSFTDLLKLQIFYRYHLSKHFYFDLGPYASIGYLNGNNGGFNTGFEVSALYSIKKIHIGTRLQAGWQLINSEHAQSSYFGLYSTPIVLGLNF